jgi:hypothetical protein
MKKLSHYDSAGSARMVDISAKQNTKRMARAHAFVRIQPAVLRKLPQSGAHDSGPRNSRFWRINAFRGPYFDTTRGIVAVYGWDAR